MDRKWSSLRAFDASKLISSTVLMRQRRGNPEMTLDSSLLLLCLTALVIQFKKLVNREILLPKIGTGLLHLRRDTTLPHIRSLAPTARNDELMLPLS